MLPNDEVGGAGAYGSFMAGAVAYGLALLGGALAYGLPPDGAAEGRFDLDELLDLLPNKEAFFVSRSPSSFLDRPKGIVRLV